MKFILQLVLMMFAAILILTGCVTDCSQNPKAAINAAVGNAITVDDALASIGRGLYLMKTNENGIRTGLLPDTVSVTLNLGYTEGKSQSGQFGLTIAAPPNPYVNAGINGSAAASNSQTAQVQNTITITFKNIVFAGGSASGNANSSSNTSSTNSAAKSDSAQTSSGTIVYLPLLKDPDTAIRMLSWITTNSFNVSSVLEGKNNNGINLLNTSTATNPNGGSATMITK
jgi:hypothetical protein